MLRAGLLRGYSSENCGLQGGSQGWGQSRWACSPTHSLTKSLAKDPHNLPSQALAQPAGNSRGHLLPSELRPSFLPKKQPSCFRNDATVNDKWVVGTQKSLKEQNSTGPLFCLSIAQKSVSEAGHFRVWPVVAVHSSSCRCPLLQEATHTPQAAPPSGTSAGPTHGHFKAANFCFSASPTFLHR